MIITWNVGKKKKQIQCMQKNKMGGMDVNEQKIYLEVPEFTGENVPVTVAATVMKKDQQFIRQGIIHGLLPFGVGFKKKEALSMITIFLPWNFGSIRDLYIMAKKHKKITRRVGLRATTLLKDEGGIIYVYGYCNFQK